MGGGGLNFVIADLKVHAAAVVVADCCSVVAATELFSATRK